MFGSFNSIISKRQRSVYGNKIRGQIVNIDDPMNLGRIKVRARDIHDGIPDEDLPWSLPNEGFGHGVEGSGKKDSPRVGAYVFLSHQDDSLYHPQWEHGPSTTNKQIDELDKNTPGHIDAAGNLHKREYGDNNDKNIVTDQHQSGTQKVIDTDGSVKHDAVKDYTHTTYGDTHTIQGDDKTTLVLNFKKVIFKSDQVMMPDPMPGGQYQKPGSAPSARQKPVFNPPSGTTY